MSSVKTPLEMFYRWEKEVPEQVFLRQSLGNGDWREYRWRQFADRVRRLAAFLLQLELPAGSNIAIWSANCADWVVVDVAIMLSGHVSVPLYAGQDADSARYILEQSESRVIFLGEFGCAGQFEQIRPDGTVTVGIRGCSLPCDYALENIVDKVTPYLDSPIPAADDLFTIVYSSGTSGNPKGVMHIHGTPGKVLPVIIKALGSSVAGLDFEGERERFFAFLSMAHIAERAAVELSAIYCNGSLSISAGVDAFAAEIQSVQPSVFFAVPRLWAKFKAGVDAALPAEAQAALGETEKLGIRYQLGLAKAHCIISGAAPIPVEIQQWFLNMGIALREAYSMTETFLQGTMWQSDQLPVPGCVGTPSEGLVVKISDDGEICLKLPAPMQGYYKEPEKTAEVMADGWYRTGDTGYIDGDGNLWVTGRLGDIFKTSKGKFVHPVTIEEKFGAVRELEQLLIIGQGRDQPLLLVNLSAYGKSLTRETVQKTLIEKLNAVNDQLSPFEKVAKIYISAEEWTPASGLVTPTMKLRRRQIEDCYRDWIERQSGKQPVAWE